MSLSIGPVRNILQKVYMTSCLQPVLPCNPAFLWFLVLINALINAYIWFFFSWLCCLVLQAFIFKMIMKISIMSLRNLYIIVGNPRVIHINFLHHLWGTLCAQKRGLWRWFFICIPKVTSLQETNRQ